MPVVIDDRLQLDVLAGTATEPVAAELDGGGVLTTSAWYYRLGRAAFNGSDSGALSGRLAALSPAIRARVSNALVELPATIGVLHPRVVVPVMFTLRARRPLNVLGAEALAVALLVPADLLVTTDAPLLRAAAQEAAITYRVLP